MVFAKGGGNTDDKETEAWSVAKNFTFNHITDPLNRFKYWSEIARFGTIETDEDMLMSDDQVDRKRAEAVRRCWAILKGLIDDTGFKIIKKDRDKRDKIHEKLVKEYPKYMSRLLIPRTDNFSHDDRIEVNEEWLEEVLLGLEGLKRTYLQLLDNTGLLFRISEAFDVEREMKEFEEGG